MGNQLSCFDNVRESAPYSWPKDHPGRAEAIAERKRRRRQRLSSVGSGLTPRERVASSVPPPPAKPAVHAATDIPPDPAPANVAKAHALEPATDIPTDAAVVPRDDVGATDLVDEAVPLVASDGDAIVPDAAIDTRGEENAHADDALDADETAATAIVTTSAAVPPHSSAAVPLLDVAPGEGDTAAREEVVPPEQPGLTDADLDAVPVETVDVVPPLTIEPVEEVVVVVVEEEEEGAADDDDVPVAEENAALLDEPQPEVDEPADLLFGDVALPSVPAEGNGEQDTSAVEVDVGAAPVDAEDEKVEPAPEPERPVSEPPVTESLVRDESTALPSIDTRRAMFEKADDKLPEAVDLRRDVLDPVTNEFISLEVYRERQRERAQGVVRDRVEKFETIDDEISKEKAEQAAIEAARVQVMEKTHWTFKSDKTPEKGEGDNEFAHYSERMADDSAEEVFTDGLDPATEPVIEESSKDQAPYDVDGATDRLRSINKTLADDEEFDAVRDGGEIVPTALAPAS